jgi:hypothetical protein
MATSPPNPIVTVTLSGTFDGTTRIPGTAKVERIPATSAGWKVTDSAGVSLVNAGELCLRELDNLASAADPYGAGLTAGTAMRVVYIQYTGVGCTEFAVQVAQRLGSSLVTCGPVQVIDPSTANPDTILSLALPTLDHCLLVRSNLVGAQTVSVCLQTVDASTEFGPTFESTPASFIADQPFRRDTIDTSTAVLVDNSIQPADPTAGAFACVMPATILLDSRIAVLNLSASTNVITVGCGGADGIQDPDTGAIAATATLNVAFGCTCWQLAAVGPDTYWLVIWKN